MTEFLFLGSKITVDVDGSHEIKRCLLLGRKAMTMLDSVLKSKGITLQTKVCIVKAMVFPVVMHECENWTVKKAECQRIDGFKLWCWRRLLSPSDSKIKPVHPKGNQPWILIGRTDAKAKAPILWPPDVNTQVMGKKTLVLGKIEGKRKRGLQRMRRWMPSLIQRTWAWTNSGRWWGVARCSPWGRKESYTTWWLNTSTKWDVLSWVLGSHPRNSGLPRSDRVSLSLRSRWTPRRRAPPWLQRLCFSWVRVSLTGSRVISALPVGLSTPLTASSHPWQALRAASLPQKAKEAVAVSLTRQLVKTESCTHGGCREGVQSDRTTERPEHLLLWGRRPSCPKTKSLHPLSLRSLAI